MEIEIQLLLAAAAGLIGGALAIASPRVRAALPTWVWPAFLTWLILVLVAAGLAWLFDWRSV